MKIIVERGDWTKHSPELTLVVGDAYSNFTGTVPEPLQSKLSALASGFSAGSLKREVCFAAPIHGSELFDFIYYHTATHKGYTAVETLKTFLSRALNLAADTGRKKVAFLLGGPDANALTDQLVEGALVGTYSYREFKKDSSDRFADVELFLCLAPVIAEAPVEVESPASSVEESPSQSSDQPEVSASAQVPDDAAETNLEPSSDEAVVDSQESAPEADSLEPEPEPEPEPVSEAETQPAALEVPDSHATALIQAADDHAVAVGTAFGDGVNLARTLVNQPACDCTPEFLVKTCKKIATTHRFAFQSFGPKQLETHAYAGLVAVGKGADNSPRMMEMTYTPAEPTNVHLVLVGKGVTFDTGGISIKPAEKMQLMIGDMAGAAAVIGAMEILGRLRPSIKVTGLIVSAENKPGSKSYRPGDVIRYKNGLSVHVENTDAEGRLILADGLIRAGELGATHIIDIATLTGACARALGPSFTGVMGANRKLVNAITRAGGNHGESYWRLPMPLEYEDMLKSTQADLNNVGGPNAGATTAALFLKEFAPAGIPWVHLDIAGTFWKEKPWKYYSEGPSGTGVKTLADLALRWQEHLG